MDGWKRVPIQEGNITIGTWGGWGKLLLIYHVNILIYIIKQLMKVVWKNKIIIIFKLQFKK